MARFEIVDPEMAPAAFNEALAGDAFAGRRDHPVYGDFGRHYYPIALGGAIRNCPFIVADQGRPSLLVQCSARDGVLSHFGFPIRLEFRAGLETAARRKNLGPAFAHIERLARTHGIHTAKVAGGPAGGLLSPIDQACLDRGGRPGFRIRAEADLAVSEEDLRRDVRDSYRSLINWGQQHIRLVYANAANPDRALLEALRDFHVRTAGRAVHGEATWSALFEPVARGAGEISMGYLDDGELVAGALVVDGGETAYYVLAVYDRERFDKPMGHGPLFDAMLRARARGRRYFDFGEVHPRGAAEPKEFNIGFFKKGFTSRLVAETVWTLPYGETPGGTP
jgi:hypothetical protein